jgi:RNA polymerase sigma-70 factor, ECF subfamily
LLEQFAAGDATAFADFYDLCAPRVYGLLLHVLKDEAIAASALEETFVDAWSGAPRACRVKVDPLEWVSGLAFARARAMDSAAREPHTHQPDAA